LGVGVVDAGRLDHLWLRKDIVSCKLKVFRLESQNEP
jgi:hypothetical protein